MRGEFIGVWSDTWREIWQPLIDQAGLPEDIYCELYRALSPALSRRPSVEDLAAMGELARQRVLARHDVDREAARLAALFHDAVLANGVAGLVA